MDLPAQIRSRACAGGLLNRCKNRLQLSGKNFKLHWAEEPTRYYKCNTRASAPCWLKGCEPSAMLWRLHKEIDDVYHVSIKLQRWLQSQLITGLQIDICMSDKAKLMEGLAPSCARVRGCAHMSEIEASAPEHIYSKGENGFQMNRNVRLKRRAAALKINNEEEEGACGWYCNQLQTACKMHFKAWTRLPTWAHW